MKQIKTYYLELMLYIYILLYKSISLKKILKLYPLLPFELHVSTKAN